MPTGLVDRGDARVRSDQRTRRLFVVWQHPKTGQFVRVAHLDVDVDGQYVFEYEPDAEHGVRDVPRRARRHG